MNRFEKIVLGITGGSHLSVHALMLALPSLIPILRNEFTVGLDTLGLVVSISAFMFGLGAIPSGWAERWLGGRTLLLLYLFGSGLSAMLVSISGSFMMMVAGLGLYGFFLQRLSSCRFNAPFPPCKCTHKRNGCPWYFWHNGFGLRPHHRHSPGIFDFVEGVLCCFRNF